MSYKPRYCCQCGEQIDRSVWKPWTSRKFCEVCETEFPWQNWMPAVWCGLGIVGMLFGFGSFLKKAEKPLGVTTNQNSTITADKNVQNQKTAQSSTAVSVQNSVGNQNVSTRAAAQDSVNRKAAENTRLVKPAGAPDAASEATYYCGAQTKKGTPCTRRVKGGGRCWQHAGQPAMLPPEKLAAAH